MQGIFDQLANFDDNLQVTPEFEAAMHAFMALYCETRRSHGMMGVVIERMKDPDKPKELPPKQDKTKNMWRCFSRETMVLKRDGNLDPEKKLPKWCSEGKLDFKLQKDLIGANGELLIAKLGVKLLRDHVTEKRFDEEATRAKRARPDPTKFTIPKRFIPNWLLGDWTADERAALGFPEPQ